MAVVYQNSSTSTVTVLNGDEMIIRDFSDITTTSGDGVVLSGGSLQTDLWNFGNIIAADDGVDVIAVKASIVNFGTITSIGNDAINLVNSGSFPALDLVNYGTLTAQDIVIDARGLAFSTSGDAIDVTVTNYGAMVSLTSREIINDGALGTTRFINHGFVRGGELALNGDSTSHLFNTGTIDSPLIDMNSASRAVLLNHGTIGGGTIDGSLNGDRFVNSGTIYGTIRLGEGSDHYEALGSGTVDGFVRGDAGNDTLAGGAFEDSLLGGADDDLIVGRGGDDALSGDAGNDVLLGGAGNDSMTGGTGNDTMNGQDGDDSLDGGDGDDLLTGGAGADEILGGANNDVLNGQDGEDILEGEGGNDILRGGNGDDALAGGDGADILTGGQGADAFVFRAVSETAVGATRDQILDFQQRLDLIIVAGLSPGIFEFRGTNAFAPSGNPELRLFETPTGSTIVQLDNNGDGVTDAEIRVAGVTGMTAEDFVL